MKDCGLNGGRPPPKSSPESRRREGWGKGQECSGWGRASRPGTPLLGRPGTMGLRGCLRVQVWAGVPQCEWPIILPRGWELRVSLCPPGKAPLGDNHPGREVEVVIRVFIGGQASSENS